MMDPTLHLGPEELDLWLEGRLPIARTSHLETCEQCRTAGEDLKDLVQQLTRLPMAAPGAGLADRVMQRVRLGAAAEHLTPDDLDLWIAGEPLPAVRQSHLRNCPQCQELADAERVLVLRLQALPLYNPAIGFADRVMRRVDLPVTSVAGAWRLWRTRVFANPLGVAASGGVAMLIGGSMAASAAWAAANQDVITGVGPWALAHGQQLLWQGVDLAGALLREQSWYAPLRAALTPARLAALGGVALGLYAAGMMALRRLLALPTQAARAAS